ncbi:MAG: transporter [Betaproteobacteria bacterium]|nr:transporter [Betaproteobacteria bacterium]
MSRSLFKCTVFFPSLTLFAAFSAPAMQPLITDDVDTLGSGGHQLEVAYNWDRTRWNGETERRDSLPLTYTYGLSEAVDVFVGIDYSHVRISGERSSGFGNTGIGFKWLFFESEASGTRLALKPEVLFPVGSGRERRGLGSGKTSGSLTLILSQKVPFGSVHFNAGAGRERYHYSDDNTTNRHFSVAPVWDVSEKWILALNAGIDLARSGEDTVRSRFAEIAAIYSPGQNLDLAVGYIRAFDSRHPRAMLHGVTTGVTWRF